MDKRITVLISIFLLGWYVLFWAPVFTDKYTIIFLKRNKQNEPIIEKYRIPRSHFKVVKGQELINKKKD